MVDDLYGAADRRKRIIARRSVSVVSNLTAVVRDAFTAPDVRLSDFPIFCYQGLL